MSRAKPSTVRVYFDADVLGLANIVCQVRADFTYPGDRGARIKKLVRPPCPVTDSATKDSVWIPEVAARGWLIITRDKAIQGHPAEINAVRDSGAKMVNLASADARDKWGQLEVLMSKWREIETLMDQDGPFIYVASRTARLRPIDLTG